MSATGELWHSRPGELWQSRESSPSLSAARPVSGSHIVLQGVDAGVRGIGTGGERIDLAAERRCEGGCCVHVGLAGQLADARRCALAPAAELQRAVRVMAAAGGRRSAAHARAGAGYQTHGDGGTARGRRRMCGRSLLLLPWTTTQARQAEQPMALHCTATPAPFLSKLARRQQEGKTGRRLLEAKRSREPCFLTASFIGPRKRGRERETYRERRREKGRLCGQQGDARVKAKERRRRRSVIGSEKAGISLFCFVCASPSPSPSPPLPLPLPRSRRSRRRRRAGASCRP